MHSGKRPFDPPETLGIVSDRPLPCIGWRAHIARDRQARRPLTLERLMSSTSSTRLSADSQFWWDGREWRQMSPDGRHYWDGSSWQPTGWHRPGVVATPKRRGRAALWALIVVGTLLAATGSFVAASNVANVPDAVSFLTAHKCATARSGSCYVEKNGTVAAIVSQIGLDSDQSMNSCTYRITFDDVTTQLFPANCSAFSSGDRVTGRFWKGQLVLLTDSQGEVYSNFGGVGPIVAASVGVMMVALGLIAVIVALLLLRGRRRSAASQPST
jgi:hypothetical protein